MFFHPLRKNKMDQGVADFRNTEGGILLDVRTPEEYAAGHVADSLNLELDEIHRAAQVIPKTNAPLFVYCFSGARSSAAVTALKRMGYTHVENIGGINSYTGTIEKGE